MKTSNLIILIAAIALTSCKTSVYTASELKTHTNSHETVAILPFTVSIKVGELSMLPQKMSAKKMKEMEAKIRKQEKEEAYLIQKDLYTALSHKMKNYTVKIQSINKTNAILKEGIKYEDLLLIDNVELAKILEVDAVVIGTINRDQPLTTIEAIALGIASSLTKGLFFSGYGYGIMSNLNKVVLNAAIYNGSEGSLLWEFNESAHSNYLNNNIHLVQPMLKKISRRFPYFKTA